MAVGYPTLDAEEIAPGLWEAYCDGFTGYGATESEAMDNAVHRLRQFRMNEKEIGKNK